MRRLLKAENVIIPRLKELLGSGPKYGHVCCSPPYFVILLRYLEHTRFSYAPSSYPSQAIEEEESHARVIVSSFLYQRTFTLHEPFIQSLRWTTHVVFVVMT